MRKFSLFTIAFTLLGVVVAQAHGTYNIILPPYELVVPPPHLVAMYGGQGKNRHGPVVINASALSDRSIGWRIRLPDNQVLQGKDWLANPRLPFSVPSASPPDIQEANTDCPRQQNTQQALDVLHQNDYVAKLVLRQDDNPAAAFYVVWTDAAANLVLMQIQPGMQNGACLVTTVIGNWRDRLILPQSSRATALGH